ncbi:MAG TPA: hypothetical protein VK052_03035 [Zeimonas sp.]|nr:hypothetical protein [Zeimonas sp.]
MSRTAALASGIFISLALALRIATESTTIVGYLMLAVYALLGRRQAIEALALSWLFGMFNPGIAAEATAASALRYVVLLSAATSVLVRSRALRENLRAGRVTTMTLLLGLFFVVHAVLFSPVVDVSVLKAVSWTLAMATLIAAWTGLNEEGRAALADRIFGGLTLLMIVSLPLLTLPVGYLRNGTGFQGVLNHPQAFGPAMALLGAWAAGRMLGERRPPWSLVLVVGACLVLVILSEARTAGFALVLAMAIAVVTVSRLSGRPMRAILPGLKSRRVAFIAALAASGAIVSAAQLERVVTDFIAKSGRAEVGSALEAYERSRGGKMEEMWANIQQKPFQGIGFGVASDPRDMDVPRDPVLGLPTSAPIEKGVLPLAVLEEVGLIGFLMVAAWVLILLRRSAQGGIVPFAVALTALLLNLGEANLFSPGGMGLLSLVLIGWAFASGYKLNRVPR